MRSGGVVSGPTRLEVAQGPGLARCKQRILANCTGRKNQKEKKVYVRRLFTALNNEVSEVLSTDMKLPPSLCLQDVYLSGDGQ